MSFHTLKQSRCASAWTERVKPDIKEVYPKQVFLLEEMQKICFQIVSWGGGGRVGDQLMYFFISLLTV